jgi:hypothetical protein
MTKIEDKELASILLCAFRYSLGRMTYITSDCAGWLKQYWHIMPHAWQKQIQDDIREAIEKDCAGHACDIEVWKAVARLPVKEPPHETDN